MAITISEPLHALKELSTIIALGEPVDSVFETALEQLVAFMGADTGSIQILGQNGTLQTVAIHGEIAERLFDAVTEFSIHDGGLQTVLDSDHAHVIYQLTKTLPLASPLAALLSKEGLTTAIFIALKVKGKSIGTLSVAFRSPLPISPTRLAWFEAMTNLISISLFNAQLLADLQANQAQLRDAWKAVTDAQEMERSRLSRELHDEVGQALTSLMLRLKALQAEKDIEVVSARLNGLRYLTGETLEEVRRISLDLHPIVFDELGLIPAIRSYVEERSALTQTQISFRAVGTPYPLRPEWEIACYRAVQEGLTNVIRHARARHAAVELTFAEKAVTLSICDDGMGIRETAEITGIGLIGMQERVRLVGGTVEIASAPGHGVMLSIVFPRES